MERMLEERYEGYRERIKNLTIMSDIFMRNVFKKRECTEHVLRVIMERPDLAVEEQVLQADYKNLQGRSAILDCVARDSGGQRYGVEIQQDIKGASPKRARYYTGMMDMNALDEGQDFEELPETYLIFITGKDALGHGLPLYRIRRRIDGVEEGFRDGSHIIYVDAGNEEDTELGRLMHDFRCKSADEMYNDVLARRVRELKETKEGVDGMCKEMEAIYNEGREEGHAQGREEGRTEGLAEGIEIGEERGERRGEERGQLRARKEAAFNLAKRGMKEPDIADILMVSASLVKEWLSGGASRPSVP